jgi:arylsulfatase A-like enzyme
MVRTASIASVVVGVLGSLAASCSAGEAPPRSAVLITLDTTRLDALGVYGGVEGLTPNLDRLAERSLRYEWARTVAPLTLPAHASMFTGLYPPRHGVRGNGPATLTREATTVAERARAAGFQTGGFVACLALDRTFGIAQGFDAWGQPTPGERRQVGQVSDRPARAVVVEAVRWLAARDPSKPFFLWVHLFEPHAPYDPPAPFRSERTPYHGEVAAMDAAVGELIAALEENALLEQAFVAVVADHGEGLGEHGEKTHGTYCWDATVRVPMLLHYRDGYEAGEASLETVSVVDVAPTLLQAMELELPADLDGLSLYYQSVPTDRGVYFESYDAWRRFGWSPLTGWADAHGKYVRGAREELFDTRADPGELQELLANGTALPERYVEGIGSVTSQPALESAGERAVPEEILLEMARLGYGTTHERAPEYPGPLAELGRADPRDRLEQFDEFARARNLVESGNNTAAIELLEQIVAGNPFNTTALDWLATALIASNEHERAIGVLRARLVHPPERIATHRDLVKCFTANGDDESARVHSLRSLRMLVDIHELRGERQEASKYRALLEDARRSVREGRGGD